MDLDEYSKNFIEWEKIYHSYDEVKDITNLPDWFKDFTKNIGDKYKDCRGREVTLIGMSETNEDYYFIIQDSNGNRIFESCVGNLDPLQ